MHCRGDTRPQLLPIGPPPAGRNQISKFDNVTYLRQFKHMRIVNLAGNPLSSDPEYRSYILSHIRDLTYLDYRRINPADVAAAMEQHQVRAAGPHCQMP